MVFRPSPQPEPDSRGSVSHWLDGVRTGDNAACQELWNRYFGRLVTVAQSRLSKLARNATGEDIALSALNSVMIGMREDRFPSLSDRDSLWPLLVTITARKAISEHRREFAKKRNRKIECRLEDLRDYLGVEPSPEFAAAVVDELERLVRVLGDPTLRQIVELRLAGYTNAEVADKFACATRTVIRKLKRIRQEWRATMNDDDDSTGEA